MTFTLEILGTLIRALAIAIAGVLIQHGWITPEQGVQLVSGLIMLGVALVWSIYRKYGNRLKFLVAAGSPTTMSEKQVKDAIAMGARAPVTTPQTEKPSVTIK